MEIDDDYDDDNDNDDEDEDGKNDDERKPESVQGDDGVSERL